MTMRLRGLAIAFRNVGENAPRMGRPVRRRVPCRRVPSLSRMAWPCRCGWLGRLCGWSGAWLALCLWSARLYGWCCVVRAVLLRTSVSVWKTARGSFGRTSENWMRGRRVIGVLRSVGTAVAAVLLVSRMPASVTGAG